jgi:DNA-nicking Smr family endonuclease
MKLADLKTIQVELKERLVREAEQVRIAKEAALQAKRDKASSHDLFMRAIGKVTPLVDGSYRRAGVGEDVIKNLQRGHWRIQGVCDLHDLRVDEARSVLAAHIQQGLHKGWRATRIVHGQGFGSAGGMPVLKTKVQSWLVQMEAVTAFVQAKPEQGGAGALVVLIG